MTLDIFWAKRCQAFALATFHATITPPRYIPLRRHHEAEPRIRVQPLPVEISDESEECAGPCHARFHLVISHKHGP